jgi:hypothetical protein
VHVNATGAAQANLNTTPLPLPLPQSAPSAPRFIEDSVSGLLAQFSSPAIHAALHVADNSSLVDAFIHQAAEAVSRHDVAGAIHTIGELLHKQPDADFRVLNDPALAPIHTEVRELVGRVTLEAKLDASNTLAAGAHLIATRISPPESPSTLALANQFFETGQYVNYIRAAELGRLVIAWGGAPDLNEAPLSKPLDRKIADAVNKLGQFWRRAPVLFLLLAWLLLGVILIPVNGETWGIGFLVIVGMQFVFTIRNWQGRR